MSEAYQGKDLVALGALLERSRLAGQLGMQFGGDRDMYQVLGYSQQLTFDQYQGEYNRGDIAGRIVDLPASDTWRIPPTLQDGVGTEETPFLVACRELAGRLRIWHYLERLDRLAGIGRFGALLIGARDNQPLSAPLKAASLRGPADILYLSVFAEGSVSILTFDRDPQSARFGLPETYQVQMGAGSLGFGSEVVHWTRLIHVADDLTEDEVYGRPRLERVFNRLQDLQKIVGGGAEAAWRVMDRGLHADVRDGFALADPDAVSDEIENYLHGLQRFIRTQGMTVTPLGADMVDPSGLFGIAISLIAAAANIPQRILIGSEAGELASSQDAAQWAGQIRSRRTKFAEPIILRAFIDRLIWAGALPAPTDGLYTVTWAPLFELDELQRGQVAGAYAGAIAAYAPGGATDAVVPVAEFRQKWLLLPPEPEDTDAPSQLARRQMADITKVLTDAGATLPAAAEVAGFDADDVALLTPEPEPEPEPQPVPAALQPFQPGAQAVAEPYADEDADATAESEDAAEPEDTEDNKPATNEQIVWAAVAAEYGRAAEMLREIVHADVAES